METIRLYPECVKCLLSKQLEKCPEDAPVDKKVEYIQKVLRIVADAPKSTSAPVLVRGMYDLQTEMFGIYADYAEIKSKFNRLMLKLEEKLWNHIWDAKDPLEQAIQYAMIGNYIDFGAKHEVMENQLSDLLSKPESYELPEEVYQALTKMLF